MRGTKLMLPLIAVLSTLAAADAWALPIGFRVNQGDLEYADEITLGRALEGRREVG